MNLNYSCSNVGNNPKKHKCKRYYDFLGYKNADELF